MLVLVNSVTAGNMLLFICMEDNQSFDDALQKRADCLAKAKITLNGLECYEYH